MKQIAFGMFFIMPLMGQLLPGPIFRPPAFPPALQTYLELSNDQVNAITRLNAAYQQFQLEKSQRTAQVQLELAQETAKQNLDAMALGVRHLELEAIRREMQAQQAKTFTEVQNVLTAAQKTKAQALIEAMRLQSLACDAQTQNLIPIALPGNRGSIGGVLPDGSQGFASFLLGVPQLGFGCATGFRTGQFSFLPQQEQPQPGQQ
jgi:hypothetical protein